MATLGATFFDLIDLHKRQDNGQMATIIELLKENNAIIKHILMCLPECASLYLREALARVRRIWSGT